jgi:replication factor A1
LKKRKNPTIYSNLKIFCYKKSIKQYGKHIGRLIIILQARGINNHLSLDFKKMIEIVLQKKQDISAEDVREMIDEKKRKIGAGYLTDQGALFLVAADLGVSFENNQTAQTSIKDLYIGANDVNLTARVLTIFPIKKYTRRDTNEEIQNRTLTIYDKESSIKLRLWDQHVTFPEDNDLKPGDLIRISHGYTKSGFDNKPLINLGSKGMLEKSSRVSNEYDEDDNLEIPTIDSITKTVDEIKVPIDNVIVTGVISSNPRVSRYMNFRNEPGKSLHISLSNEDQTKTLHTIIWNINEDKIPEIFTQGSKIKLIGVKIKQGNPQYSNEEFEIHGDEGTIIQLQKARRYDEEGIEIEEQLREEEFDGGSVVILKVLSKGSEFENSVNENFLAIDKDNQNFLSVVIDPRLIQEKISPGMIIEGIPNRIFGNVVYFTNENSYVRIVTETNENSFPDESELETKIKNIEVSEKPYIIEAIVLQPPNTSNITTKSGEDVTVSETLLGDDTGEIRLTGWRDQSTKISKLNVGDRVKVVGAVAGMGGRENRLEITLKAFSEIRNME